MAETQVKPFVLVRVVFCVDSALKRFSVSVSCGLRRLPGGPEEVSRNSNGRSEY